MDGITIIGALLQADTALLAKVPAAQMKAGKLDDGAPLPSLLARSVSEVERIHLTRGSVVHVTERVRVTTRAGSYRDMVAIDLLVREACAGFVGPIAGATEVSVLPGGRGPDLNGPGGSFERTRDFLVAFNTPTT